MKNDFKKFYKNKLYLMFIISFIVFVFGVLLMMFNSRIKDPAKMSSTINSMDYSKVKGSADYSKEDSLEKRLKVILRQVDGVGKLEVMITMENKGEIVLNKEYPSTKSYAKETDEYGNTSETKNEELASQTVIINTLEGEAPIVVKEMTPTVRGVLIIAEGADHVVVKNNIINAAKVLLDVPVNRIEVLKMNYDKESVYE